MGIYIDMALLAIMLIFLIVSAKRGFLITLLEVLVLRLPLFQPQICASLRRIVFMTLL